MQWKIFFDGACHLCSREIDHYRTLPGAEKIEFIDIASVHFDASKFSLNAVEVNRSIHVMSPSGEIFTGVNGFIEIWKLLPKYRVYAELAKQPLIHPLLKVGYRIFANLRPYLPKRKSTCSTCDSRSELKP